MNELRMMAESQGSDGKNFGEKESFAQVGNSREQQSGRERGNLSPVGSGKERGAQLRVAIQQPAQMSQGVAIKSRACRAPLTLYSRMHVVNAETDSRAFPFGQPVKGAHAQVFSIRCSAGFLLLLSDEDRFLRHLASIIETTGDELTNLVSFYTGRVEKIV